MGAARCHARGYDRAMRERFVGRAVVFAASRASWRAS